MRTVIVVVTAIWMAAVGAASQAQTNRTYLNHPSSTKTTTETEQLLDTGKFRFQSNPDMTCPPLWTEQAEIEIAPLRRSKNWAQLRDLMVRYNCGSDYAYMMIGRTYMEQGQYSTAAAYFNEASIISTARTTPKLAVCKKNPGCGFSVEQSVAAYMAQNRELSNAGPNPNTVAPTVLSQNPVATSFRDGNKQAPTCGKGFYYRDGLAYHNPPDGPAGCVYRDCAGRQITAEQAYDLINCESVQGSENQWRDSGAVMMAGPKPNKTNGCLDPIQVAMYQARVGRNPPNPCPAARKRKN